MLTQFTDVNTATRGRWVKLDGKTVTQNITCGSALKYVSKNTWWLIIISHQPQMMTLVIYYVVALNKVQYATHLRKPYFGAVFCFAVLISIMYYAIEVPRFQQNDFPSFLLIYRHTSSVYTTLYHIVRSSFMYYSCVRTFVNCESKTKQHPQTRKP